MSDPKTPASFWESLNARLPGGAVIWIFIVVELLTFGAFFLAFAASYHADPNVFSSSQALLHPGMGTINTAVLLTGSWMAARAVIAHHKNRAAPWLVLTGLSGIVFLAIKTTEYVHIFGQGIFLSTNTFWFYYIFLTIMHYMHVAFGVGLMFWMAYQVRKSDGENSNVIEASAAYWHLVDLIWIVLFPIIYLMKVA